MVQKEFEISQSRGTTLAWARVPARQSGHSRPQCREHGPLSRLGPEALTIEMNGVTWEIDPTAVGEDEDSVELGYCPDCVDADLRTGRDDRDDMALLREAVAEEWAATYRPGQMNSTLFSVAAIDVDEATPEYCPYCSATLETRADGVVACSAHGRLRVDVVLLGEEAAPAPEAD